MMNSPLLENLSTITLQQTLQETFHPDSTIRTSAEKRLQGWWTHPEMVSCILHHFTLQNNDRTIAYEHLLLLSISLKNIIQLRWKGRGKDIINCTKMEKEKIKTFLFTPQEMNPIQIQLILCIEKIARMEWPSEWPELVPKLMAGLQLVDEAAQCWTWYLWKHICKILASRRLMTHKKAFQQLASQVFPTLYERWKVHMEQTLHRLQQYGVVDAALETSLKMMQYSTKTLLYLMVHGFQGILVTPELMMSFFQDLHAYMQTLVHIIERQGVAATLLLTKPLLSMARIVVDVQKQHSVEFRSLLRPFLQLFGTCVMSHSSTSHAPLLLHAFAFLTNVVNCRMYSPSSKSTAISTPGTGSSLTPEMIQEAHQAVQSVMGAEHLPSLLRHIILQHLPYTVEDIEEWEADPEGFFRTQESLTADESRRAAAERLFLTLVQQNRELLCPVMLQLMEQLPLTMTLVQGPAEAILQLDAIYTAFGTACYDLHEYVDFANWISNAAVPGLQMTSTALGSLPVPVLRRRLVWVMGCWMGQVKSEIRGPMYQAFMELLMENSVTSDLAVKQTVFDTLQASLNDWEVDPKALLPYAKGLIEASFNVLQNTQHMETRLKILTFLTSLVENAFRSETAELQETLEVLIRPLPSLWHASAEESLLRGQIVLLLTRVMQVMPNGCTSTLQEILVPVILFATDLSSPDEAYLMEHGLKLWHAAMTSASQLTSRELLQHFIVLPRILQKDFEHIKVKKEHNIQINIIILNNR